MKIFNTNNIDQHSSILVIGKKDNSAIIQDILYYKQYRTLMFSKNSKKKTIPYFVKAFVNSIYFLPIEIWLTIGDILQQTSYNKMYDSSKVNKCIEERNTSHLVIDNSIYSDTFKKCRILRDAFQNSRHIKLSIILGIDTVINISPVYRVNSDYIFLCKNQLMERKEQIEYGKYYKYIDSNIDYDYLVIINKSYSDNLEDHVFYYKKN